MNALSKLALAALAAVCIATEAHAMRWYSPNTGRWLSRDPLQEKATKHLYGFVENEPIRRFDTLGLFVSANPDDAYNVALAFLRCRSWSCEVKEGPMYIPSGTIHATLNPDGSKSASFNMFARFGNSWLKGTRASCCEVRQYLMFQANNRPRSPAFEPPSQFPADTWTEDRNVSGGRVGYRTGPFYDGTVSGVYLDNSFFGNDVPTDPTGSKTGLWKYLLKVIDVCNGERTVATGAEMTLEW
jgi:hypothetical protein